MSYAHPNPTYDHDREHAHAHTDNHDDRHPALTPLIIDLIPDQTRAELEAVIDEPLAVERDSVRREPSHCFMDGRVSAGKTFGASNTLRTSLREDSENDSDAANDRRKS